MCCNHFGVYYCHRFDVLQAILVIILYPFPIHKKHDNDDEDDDDNGEEDDDTWWV
jgi:hypothetical protein